jgi:hypothetical protein
MADREDDLAAAGVDRAPTDRQRQAAGDHPAPAQAIKGRDEPQAASDVERKVFGNDAREAARETLSRPTKADDNRAGPGHGQAQPDGAGARARAELRAAVNPYVVNDLGRTLATGQHSAPPDRRPLDRRADGGLDLGKLVRASKEAKAQQIEEAALGRGDAAMLRENPEARSKVAQAVARGHAQGGEGQRQDQGQAGPTRESGQGPQRSAGRYGVLGR